MKYKHLLSPPFAGHITVTALPVVQRMKLNQELIAGKDIESMSLDEQLALTVRFIEIVLKQFDSMDATYERDDKAHQLESIDDFSCFEAAQGVLCEIGRILVQGVPLGDSKPQSESNAPDSPSGESPTEDQTTADQNSTAENSA